MIAIDRNPSARDIRFFGLLWLVFFAALAAVVLWRPAGLLGAAGFLVSMWLISLVFNSEDRSAQLAGVLLPLLFATSGGLVRLGWVSDTAVALALGTAGVVGAAVILFLPSAGRKIYVTWMLAAVPIGWTISHFVLATVYYLVLTPIGLVLRLAGHDPMKRRFDREATSYWVKRKPGEVASRYFKQF